MTPTNDIRKMTPAQLDRAIMYQITDGRDLQRLDHLLAARAYREQGK